LKDDVEMLKRIKALHEKGKEIASRKGLQSSQGASGRSTALTSPIKRLSQSFKEEAGANAAATASSANLQKEIKSLVQNLISSQDNVVKRLTKVIDEKLDGMDEIVVELIRCKTENEKLRQKIDELTKENYKMKARASAYRPVAFGLYVKERDERLF
jgi:enoyl-[acyl-carrier-protein] reductase (NADH)